MNRIIILFVLMFAFASFLFAQPKTVTDYFLAMPAGIYSVDNEGNEIKNKSKLISFRKSLIKIEDIKNGYLRLEGVWEGWAEIVLFKKTDGSYVIAHAESGCGPGCGGFVDFYTYSAGKWKEVTKQVFPHISQKAAMRMFNLKKKKSDEPADENFMFYYLLPRVGRTLEVACNVCTEDGEDFVFMEFDWNGTRFIQK